MVIQFVTPDTAMGIGILAAASVLKVAIRSKDGWWRLIVILLVCTALWLLLHGDVMHALGHPAPAPSVPSSARIEARGAMPMTAALP